MNPNLAKYKISVIIPVYNTEKYLERCINSILNQTHKNIEIILVDDGSTDNSGEICDFFKNKDSRIIVIHKQNGGAASARNSGLEIASGDYVAFVDSDDWLAEDMYAHLLECCVIQNAEIASMRYFITKDPNAVLPSTKLNIRKYTNDRIYYYLKSSFNAKELELSTCNKLYKRSLFDQLRFPSYQLSEDAYINFLLISKINTLIVSNKYGYFYFKNDASITHTKLTVKSFDLLLVCDQIIDSCRKMNDTSILDLAIAFRCKNCLSLLIRMINSDFDYEESYSKLSDYIAENLTLIMKSPMTRAQKWCCMLLTKSKRLFELAVRCTYQAYKKYR